MNMNNTFLVITSIANHDNPVLKEIASEAFSRNVPFIIMGDTKSPKEFELPGCDFYSIEKQQAMHFQLARSLPVKHYARKNLGYLVAMLMGAEIIIETDDDNIPLPDFWNERTKVVNAHLINNRGWVNTYRYFTGIHVWPRGFALENIHDTLPELQKPVSVECPIQQGLADENPDVDAIYRLILPLPIVFNKSENIALGNNSICPFNSQNTTWFKEAFPLLYLPSYCSFRMTDIWRSFVAQRIAWTCGWPILFHKSTVKQLRNDHNLMNDFRDEVPGYNNNSQILNCLNELKLEPGIGNISTNMTKCYMSLVGLGLIGNDEMILLDNWLNDIRAVTK
jgi:hypothetical protein